MWQTIEKIRKEPDDVKRGVSFVASASITGFLLLSWFVFYSAGDNPEYKKDASDLISPFTALQKSVSAGVSDLGDNIAEAKKIAGTLSAMSASSTASSTEEVEISTTTTTTSETINVE